MLGISASWRYAARSLGVAAIAAVLSSCHLQDGARALPPHEVSALSRQETCELLQSERFAELDKSYSAVQQAYRNRTATDEDLRAAYRAFYNTDAALAPKYDLWVSKFPHSYAARLARAIYFYRVGEERRGCQCVEAASPEKLKAAYAAYDIAKADLDASFALDPKPLLSYVNAIFISHVRGDPAESRRLLDRAILIDPGNYIARASYMGAIETRWGGNQELMQAFLAECRKARLSEAQLEVLESVIVEDQGWIQQFVDHDYAAAETAYRESAALGGDPQLANLTDVLFKQRKYLEAIEPLTERLEARPGDVDILANRGFAYLHSAHPREALPDLTAAAEGGSAYAQNELGRLYIMGIRGVLTADSQTGIEWFRKAAAQGSPEGQQNLDQARKVFGIPAER